MAKQAFTARIDAKILNRSRDAAVALQMSLQEFVEQALQDRIDAVEEELGTLRKRPRSQKRLRPGPRKRPRPA